MAHTRFPIKRWPHFTCSRWNFLDRLFSKPTIIFNCCGCTGCRRTTTTLGQYVCIQPRANFVTNCVWWCQCCINTDVTNQCATRYRHHLTHILRNICRCIMCCICNHFVKFRIIIILGTTQRRWRNQHFCLIQQIWKTPRRFTRFPGNLFQIATFHTILNFWILGN